MVTRNVALNDYSFLLYQSAISQCEFIKLMVLVENCDFDSVERFWTSHPLSSLGMPLTHQVFLLLPVLVRLA